ncbi:MAG: hypothetical protein IJ523_02610 [Succinivibrionaceae bacterium]|nr:hypothetical protein [Succinivibrionaceae bacterium]
MKHAIKLLTATAFAASMLAFSLFAPSGAEARDGQGASASFMLAGSSDSRPNRYTCRVMYQARKNSSRSYRSVNVEADMDLSAMKMAEGHVRMSMPNAVEVSAVGCRRR